MSASNTRFTCMRDRSGQLKRLKLWCTPHSHPNGIKSREMELQRHVFLLLQETAACGNAALSGMFKSLEKSVLESLWEMYGLSLGFQGSNLRSFSSGIC